jgi:hypothetical protein
MAFVAETRPADLALRRRTPVLRALAWLVCWLLDTPTLDAVDQAALDAHIAALAEQDHQGPARNTPKDLRSPLSTTSHGSA